MRKQQKQRQAWREQWSALPSFLGTDHRLRKHRAWLRCGRLEKGEPWPSYPAQCKFDPSQHGRDKSFRHRAQE
eukprot:10275762-Alexandrium_andersonii.AAC.1